MKAETGRRHRNAAISSFNDTVVTAVEEEQVRTEDFESLYRLVDSVTIDFSRKSISSRLKALARKSVNAATICDHILAEQTEHNIKASTAESKVKSLLWLSKHLNDEPFEQFSKQDILGYLNSLHKPTSIDPQQKWIGSYNNRLRYYAKFFRWLYNKEEPDPRRRISPPCIQGLRQLPRQEKSSNCQQQRGKKTRCLERALLLSLPSWCCCCRWIVDSPGKFIFSKSPNEIPCPYCKFVIAFP